MHSPGRRMENSGRRLIRASSRCGSCRNMTQAMVARHVMVSIGAMAVVPRSTEEGTHTIRATQVGQDTGRWPAFARALYSSRKAMIKQTMAATAKTVFPKYSTSRPKRTMSVPVAIRWVMHFTS